VIVSNRQELARPYTPTIRKLNTLRGIRRELSRLYIDAREGRVHTTDASRLAFILATLARIIEGCELEQRVRALEKEAKNYGNTDDI
jgi:hypothetical protein